MNCAFSVVTEFSSSGEEEYPKGEVVAILLLTILLLTLWVYIGRYHPARWAPFLPGGGELR